MKQYKHWVRKGPRGYEDVGPILNFTANVLNQFGYRMYSTCKATGKPVP